VTLKELVSKYIQNTGRVFQEIGQVDGTIQSDKDGVKKLLCIFRIHMAVDSELAPGESRLLTFEVSDEHRLLDRVERPGMDCGEDGNRKRVFKPTVRLCKLDGTYYLCDHKRLSLVEVSEDVVSILAAMRRGNLSHLARELEERNISLELSDIHIVLGKLDCHLELT